ncbi:MAG: hypothetical protein WCG67_02045, partial [Ferruginibacter sp.]
DAINYPMLNVHEENSSSFETMVAINTKKEVTANETFQLKRMHLGVILMGEVKGGLHTITTGEKEMSNYVTDHRKYTPAIPYQSLVTDRLNEPDTSKWITRLYFPIFQ